MNLIRTGKREMIFMDFGLEGDLTSMPWGLTSSKAYFTRGGGAPLSKGQLEKQTNKKNKGKKQTKQNKQNKKYWTEWVVSLTRGYVGN